MNSEIWTVTGLSKPTKDNGVTTLDMTGYDVYILLNGKKYKLTNKELEQYKLEK